MDRVSGVVERGACGEGGLLVVASVVGHVVGGEVDDQGATTGEERVFGAVGCVKETMDLLVELVFGEVLPKIFNLSVEDRGYCRFGTGASVACVCF